MERDTGKGELGEYTATAGPTVLIFIVASWIIISRLLNIPLIPTYLIAISKISFEHNCLMFPNISQNSNQIGSGFPPTSDQIPLTSGSSDWPN